MTTILSESLIRRYWDEAEVEHAWKQAVLLSKIEAKVR